jgi:hypothetical protein
MFKILILLILFNLNAFEENFNKNYSPIIAQTSYGYIEGFIHKLKNGKLIDVFLGIPFAEKPIGALRLEVCFNFFFISYNLYANSLKLKRKWPQIFPGPKGASDANENYF